MRIHIDMAVNTFLNYNLEYESVPVAWKNSCVNVECTLHQLSPYIGKTKSIIARELITRYSNPGDLIVDPYSGSGTIPLEACLLDRRIFACDVNPYAILLTRAKLFSPASLEEAKSQADSLISEMKKMPDPDLRRVPAWVRKFFHSRTLKETIKAVDICIYSKNDFLLSCILGILHHQRPGFLSFPSSHLVPYLRDKNFPRDQYEELYRYRPLKPRLYSKIERAYRRFNIRYDTFKAEVKEGKIEDIELPSEFHCLITSPPYMNALDYNRDNRLRLWFITREYQENRDGLLTGSKKAFEISISNLSQKIDKSLIKNGYCIFIIGELVRNFPGFHPSQLVQNIISKNAPSLKLSKMMTDLIPDVRRSRRNYEGIKTEHILIYQKQMK